MNQTQTRSLRKKVLSLILAVVMVVSLLPISAFASGDSKASTTAATSDGYEYNIMFLDCGRKYYSVDSIKQIIDNASAAGFNYIQLAVGNDGLRFLLDDMSLTVNGTTYSSDTVSKAIHTGNERYYNFDVDELTQSEMDEIVAYAATKGMGVIPCVNTPGHMDAILSAANSLTGTTCSYNGSVRTIDVTNTTAVAFTKALLQKYIDYFAGKGCQLFNMGADEYANDKYTGGSMGFGKLQSTGEYSYYVQYVNAVAKMIKNAKMTPMAFNDGIYFNNNTSSGTFDTDIIICYWSSGWSSYTPMPASKLAGKGFKLINTNGDYYWVLGKTDAQCDAAKASNFNKTAFPGGTVSNPVGSMFCIWADYPGAETEGSVISKTAATIAAFGKALPQVKKVETVESKTVTKDNVTVTAPGLTDLTVAAADAPAIDAAVEGKVVAYDVTPATASGSYKKNGTVTLPIPEGWDASRVRGFVQNEDGSITTVTGTPADGKFTFTVPHFSVLGVYELAANAATETKTINLTVGGTKEEKLAGDYSGTRLDDAVATVTGSVAEASGKPTYQLATLGAGTFYVSTKSNDTAPTVQLTFEDAGHGQYYIKNSAGQYVYPNASLDLRWSYSLGSGKETVNVTNSGNKIVISKKITATAFWGSSYNTTAYLTLNGTEYSASGSAKDLYLYKQQTTSGGKETTLTFTGKSAGDTSVTIGNVTYKIHVVAEDLSKVTPLTIEYWITNSRLTGSDGNKALTIQATDKDVATEAGVSTADLVAKTGNKDGRTQEYWQTKILDVEKENNSTSGTELQVTKQGDDETLNGKAFTKVRYWGGAWQVYTTEWVNVDRTATSVKYTDDQSNTQTYTGDKNQLVAYYMEVVDIKNSNGTTNLHVNAADWGTKGDGTGNWGYTPESSRCSVSVQLVYEDSSTNPADTTADSLKSKTIVYGYWSGGRGLGTMIFNGEDNYQIIKVTAETGTMTSSASSSNTVTVTNFNWANNEETVWEGAATDSVSIGNPARNPSYDAPYDNLAWNTGDYNNNNAILLRVYVKAIPKSGALTVNYFVDGSTEPFYHYGINVEEKTVFDTGFARVTDKDAPGGAKLINNTVKNYAGETQTIQSDLSKMTEIGAQYRYSNYTFTKAERSTDGKTVNLYYTFNWNKAFVVDFGLPVVIRPNDVNENLKNATLTAAEITQSTTYANISVDNDKNITYTLKQTIDGEDNFSVRYMGNITTDTGTQTGQVDYSIKVIPATNVYYEDSFATFNPGAGAAADAKWSIDKDDTAAKVETNQALSALGAQDIYGYDEAYKDSTKLSMGSAHKVTVSADMASGWTENSAWPTATFTFKGTGFDVISLTDNNSGAISVKVYSVGNDGTETQVKGTLVNNYYGYTYSDGKWTVTPTGGNNALYQIPVIKISGLDYGTYKVVITASYATFADKTGDGQYNFWLDAIRVYDPMGKDNATYEQDNEGYPQYIKLRDSLVGETATAKNGSVFIDGADKADIATYANYGPNNEVYLAKGQAISFKLTGALDSIASVQIGAKSPDGTDGAAVISVNGQKVTTATEMYYAITDTAKSGNQVTIANNGTGILSLTNLKITYTESGKSVSLDKLSAADQENAVAQVRALFAAPAVEPFNPDRFDASWSRNVRKGETAKLTVKTSEDVEAITVNGETIDSFTERHERTGWGWWAKTVTYREFTYTDTATVTKDYTVCAVNGKGVSSDAITATLTVRPSVRDWLHGIIGKWF